MLRDETLHPSKLSKQELNYLWEFPHGSITTFKPDNYLSKMVLKFNDDLYASVSAKPVGHGFWGEVFLVELYRKSAGYNQQSERCVVKVADKSNPLKNILHIILNTSGKMGEESRLTQEFHGFSEILRVNNEDNIDEVYILLPYLADLSLGKLLQKPEELNQLSRKKWASFFIKLISELNEFHNQTNFLHADIKPDNIGVSLKRGPNGNLKFSKVTFFDLGNAHEFNSTGMVGDPRYQPFLENVLGTVFSGVKNEKTDVYAISITLCEVIDALLALCTDEKDKNFYLGCRDIFLAMQSGYQSKRPDLTQVKASLEKFASTYDFEMQLEEPKASTTSFTNLFSPQSAIRFFNHLGQLGQTIQPTTAVTSWFSAKPGSQ